MKLIHPISTRTDDRSIPAARNPVCGEPYDWFDTDYFRGRSLSCISFNFLVDWREHALQRVAWLKRVITEGFTTDADEIAGAILRCDTGSYVDAARLFCDRNAFALQYVLIPDIPVEAWANPANKVIVFDMTKYAAKDFAHCVQTYSAMEFVALIRSYKKDYHPIGHGKDKSGTPYRLQYSETNLEVFLSEENAQLQYEGDTGFPGDADVVLFDAEGAAKAVIELKKHAEGSRAGAARIEDESLALYLSTSPANADGQNRQPKRNDVLKYDSLNLLAAEFGCPFHQLFFPVTQECTVKVESFVPSGPNLYRYLIRVLTSLMLCIN